MNCGEFFFSLSRLNISVILKFSVSLQKGQTQISTENIAIDSEEFGGCTHHMAMLTWFVYGSSGHYEDKQPRKLRHGLNVELEKFLKTIGWWFTLLITVDELSNSFKRHFSSFIENGRLQPWNFMLLKCTEIPLILLV